MARVREAAESDAYEPELWREIVELGWPGIAVAEEHGGQDLGAVELAVLARGARAMRARRRPFLSTAMAAAVIQACGSDEQRGRWLPGLVSGELTAGIGSAELAADVVGAAVVVVLDGDDARLLESPEAEPIATIDSTRRYRQRERRPGTRWAPARPIASALRSPPRSSASPSARST